MTQTYSMRQTFDRTTGLEKVTIRDAMDLIDPRDTPFFARFGPNLANNMAFVNTPGTMVVWAQDRLRTLSGALNLAATLATNATAITVSTAARVKVGDLLLLAGGGEKVWVSAVNSDGTVATITRGWGDTSPATQASNATFTIIGSARLEGAAADFGPLEIPETDYNYTRIVQYGLSMSRNAMKQQQYAIPNEWEYQADKAMLDLARQLEIAAFRGERVERSSTVPSDMGGLGTFITVNTDTVAATALTIAKLEDMVLSCHLEGGRPDVLIMHPSRRRLITGLYANSQYLRVDRSENTLGMVVEYLETPWARLEILESRHCPTDRIYFVQGEHIGFYEYDAFFWHELGIDGDRRKAEVIGEYSLVVRNNRAHAVLTLT